MRVPLNYLGLSACFLLAMACGDNAKPATDAGLTPDASTATDAGTPGACPSGPEDLSRPPNGSLPCDLFPPAR